MGTFEDSKGPNGKIVEKSTKHLETIKLAPRGSIGLQGVGIDSGKDLSKSIKPRKYQNAV